MRRRRRAEGLLLRDYLCRVLAGKRMIVVRFGDTVEIVEAARRVLDLERQGTPAGGHAQMVSAHLLVGRPLRSPDRVCCKIPVKLRPFFGRQ